MKELSRLVGLSDYSSEVNGKIVKTVNPLFITVVDK